MTPHEHYAEAERIVTALVGNGNTHGRIPTEAEPAAVAADLMLAQVHATLALAPHNVRHDPYDYPGIPPWA